jgi:hypothetical protein
MSAFISSSLNRSWKVSNLELRKQKLTSHFARFFLISSFDSIVLRCSVSIRIVYLSRTRLACAIASFPYRVSPMVSLNVFPLIFAKIMRPFPNQEPNPKRFSYVIDCTSDGRNSLSKRLKKYALTVSPWISTFRPSGATVTTIPIIQKPIKPTNRSCDKGTPAINTGNVRPKNSIASAINPPQHCCFSCSIDFSVIVHSVLHL